MKKRFLSFAMAVCVLCLLTMTSCSAAENSILNGIMENHRFDPKVDIKRGEVAFMLYRPKAMEQSY